MAAGGLVTGAGSGIGGGSGGGLAGGGMVYGPGTSTSDSIPARLSAGEYVNDAATVRRLGPDFFDALPLAARSPRALEDLLADVRSFESMQIRPMPRMRGYAAGGLVEGAPGGSGRMAGFRGELDLNDALVLKRFSASPEFHRIILRTIGENPRTVKGLLR